MAVKVPTLTTPDPTALHSESEGVILECNPGDGLVGKRIAVLQSRATRTLPKSLCFSSKHPGMVFAIKTK